MTTAYSTSLHAMWCRAPDLDLGEELWPGIGVEYIWQSTAANSPTQSDAQCWTVSTQGYEYISGHLCEYSLEDETGEIDYWAYGATEPNGAFRCAAVSGLTPVEPKRSWSSRVAQWTRWMLGNRAQETARCVDE